MSDIHSMSGTRQSVAVPTHSAPTAQEPADRRSFADHLDLRNGGAGTDGHDDQRPFGNGTMHASVSAFGAAGLFAGATPDAVAHPLSESRSLQMNGGGAPEPVVDAAAVPPLASGTPDAECPSLALDISSTSTFTTTSDPDNVHHVSRAHGSTNVAVTPMMVSVAPSSSRRAPLDANVLTSARIVPRRPPARSAAPPLKVMIGTGNAGVTVSVVGGAEALDDEARLERAVTHLLARHGLVLGELRVARQPGDGRQQQGRR